MKSRQKAERQTATVFAFPLARAEREARTLARELVQTTPFDAAQTLLADAERRGAELVAAGVAEDAARRAVAGWIGAVRDALSREVRNRTSNAASREQPRSA